MKRKLSTAISLRRKRNEAGTALIEFGLCLAFFWTPLFLGTYQIGFNLVRAVQVTQICRDAGHMYAQGADFTAASYQSLLNSLMPANFHPTPTGNTVFYFSNVVFVDGNACVAGKMVTDPSTANQSNCPNFGKTVFTQQVTYGNVNLRGSNLGSPCPGSSAGSSGCIMNSSYTIDPTVYVKDQNAIASNLPINFSYVAQQTQLPPQSAFVAEMYVSSSDLNVWSGLGTTGEYAQSVF